MTEPSSQDLTHAVQEAIGLFTDGESPPSAATIERVRGVVATVEAETPGGAPLHAQLDNVRKWLDAIARPTDEHHRFGGTDHLRSYVLTQLRLALGALEDYRREMT